MVNKQNILTVLLVLVLLTVCVSGVVAEKLDSRKIKITARVASFQQVQINEPVAFTVNYPWPGAEFGQPLVLEDVGNIIIKSNSPWNLQIRDTRNTEFEIYVRPAGDINGSWQKLGKINPAIRGEMGEYSINWDVKIDPTQNIQGNITEKVTLGFTISKG